MTSRRVRMLTVQIKLLYIALIIQSHISVHTCDMSCQFPAEWTGEWFQRGMTTYMKIQNGTISKKGTCISYQGQHKYILRDPEEDCRRCVVIHQKHINLLQYKESFCHPLHDNKMDLCSSILSGDDTLYSIFRVNADPVPCPFTGHFTFTYNRGQRDCANPRSTIHPCTDNARLLFRFKACYDVAGTESSDEELLCLATWKEGPERYIVGKMKHAQAKTDNQLYRCFMYAPNEDKTGYNVAQSADASCDGLALPLQGARTMKLAEENQIEKVCTFPKWMLELRRWDILNGNQNYVFNHKNTTISVYDTYTTSQISSTLTCVQVVSKRKKFKIIVHYTAGCESGYRCIEIFNRNRYIIQLKIGRTSRQKETACMKYYDPDTVPYITLRSHVRNKNSAITGSISQAVTDVKHTAINTYSAEEIKTTMKCPYHGKYIAKNFIIRNSLKPGCNTSYMNIGCNSEYSMELHAKCSSSNHVDRFYCHGNWTEGETHYVIASNARTRSNYCFSYTEHEDGLYFFAKQSRCNSDYPSLGLSGSSLLFRKKGLCAVDSGSSTQSIPVTTFYVLLYVSVIVLQRTFMS